MNMDVKELIRTDLEHKGKLERYVVLKKDDKGYYIEYAFRGGAPHDNRCLDWYHSYQEDAYIRNGWVKDLSPEDVQARLDALKRDRESNIGHVFSLSSMTCGGEEDPDAQVRRAKESYDKYHPDEEFIPEDYICKVGCPAKNCRKECGWASKWTYENPVKCACWYLRDKTTMEDFINNYTIDIKATELANIL